MGDLEIHYKRLSNNFREAIQIFGPTSEDLIVTVSLAKSYTFVFFACFFFLPLIINIFAKMNL